MRSPSTARVRLLVPPLILTCNSIALSFAAHTLTLSTASLGATTLSEQCRLLEVMGREQRLAQTEAVLAKIETLHEQGIAILSEHAAHHTTEAATPHCVPF